ncbi:hypothetical protein [Undibacterium sp. Ji49W]|uniref:hypothetical protein n=1 Tax=Undibacterium sp. Ji49W TaxID=3413040 RepID=UPI003BF297B1
MAITPLPAAPTRANPTGFAAAADTFVTALPQFVTDANALQADIVTRQTDVTNRQTDITTRQADVVSRQNDVIARQTDVSNRQTDVGNSQALAAASAATALNAPGTSATSTSNLTIAGGTQSLVVQTGKAFALGQTVVVASTASPVNQMTGVITAFNSGTGALTLNASNIQGSGTFSAWTVALSGPQGAASNVLGGASRSLAVASNISLLSTSSRVQAIGMASAGLAVNLPDATTIGSGGTLFIIKNIDVYGFVVKKYNSDAVVYLQPGQIAVLYLSDNSTAAGLWEVGNQNFDGSALQSVFNGSVTAVSSNTLNNSWPVDVKPLSANKFVVTYNDNAINRINCVILDITAGNVINVGTPVAVTTVGPNYQFGVAIMSPTKLMAVYYNASTSLNEAVVMTVTGSTLTRNTAFNYYGVSATQASICAVSSTLCLATSFDGSNLIVTALSASGTTISNAGSTSLAVSGAAYVSINLLSPTLALMTYQDTSSTFAKAVTVSISGSTPTINTPVSISSVAATYVSQAVINANSVLMAWANGQASLVTVTGTIPSAGPIAVFKATGGSALSCTWSSGKGCISFVNSNNYAEEVYVSASGNTLTVGISNVLTNAGAASLLNAAIFGNKKLTVWKISTTSQANGIITEMLN